MAIICGCSRRTSSHTARASSHLSASSPLVERPMLMRSMMAEALSSPSAFTSALRRNSSAPTPTEVCASTLVVKSETTFSTSTRETFLTLAMARPTRCTSLALMCLRICAASCSPSVSSRIAARSVPLRLTSFSGILVHPITNDLRDALRILAHEAARLRELLLVGERGPGTRRRSGERRGAGRLRGEARSAQRCEEAPHQRAQYRQHQHDEHDGAEEELQSLEEQRLLPQGGLLEIAATLGRCRLLGERGVDDVDDVAARFVEAHGIL